MPHPKHLGKMASVWLASVIVAVLGSMAIAQAATRVIIPAIAVNKQAITNKQVVIAQVTSPESGWMTIHTTLDGQPGPVIGYAAVKKGTTKRLVVKLTKPAEATKQLFAIMHRDLGKKGKYEFPGADVPLMQNKKMVMKAFVASNAPKTNAITTKDTTTGSTATIQPETTTTPPPAANPAPAASSNPPASSANSSPAPAPAQPPEPAPAAPAIKEFTLTAKQWSFEPATITVNKGDRVKLTIKSIDVGHGFSLSQFNVNTNINPGQETKVEFVADQIGTFSFFCSVFCGSGHGGMRGELIVK